MLENLALKFRKVSDEYYILAETKHHFIQVFDNFSPYNMILHYLLKAIGFVETECYQEPLISIPCRYCFQLQEVRVTILLSLPKSIS